MNEAQSDLRGVLIQVTGGRLLLPNACIAEILSVADAEPIAGAPEWLLGHVHWHGWNVPLVAYSTLAGLGAHDAAQRGQRVLVLKTLSADLTMPYFALLTQGYPRLVKVNAADIEDDGAPVGDGHCVAAMARLQGEEVLVPDLDALELRLVEVLAAAA